MSYLSRWILLGRWFSCSFLFRFSLTFIGRFIRDPAERISTSKGSPLFLRQDESCARECGFNVPVGRVRVPWTRAHCQSARFAFFHPHGLYLIFLPTVDASAFFRWNACEVSFNARSFINLLWSINSSLQNRSNLYFYESFLFNIRFKFKAIVLSKQGSFNASVASDLPIRIACTTIESSRGNSRNVLARRKYVKRGTLVSHRRVQTWFLLVSRWNFSSHVTRRVSHWTVVLPLTNKLVAIYSRLHEADCRQWRKRFIRRCIRRDARSNANTHAWREHLRPWMYKGCAEAWSHAFNPRLWGSSSSFAFATSRRVSSALIRCKPSDIQ